METLADKVNKQGEHIPQHRTIPTLVAVTAFFLFYLHLSV